MDNGTYVEHPVTIFRLSRELPWFHAKVAGGSAALPGGGGHLRAHIT